MHKLQLLRDHLRKFRYADDAGKPRGIEPDDLHVWADEGQVISYTGTEQDGESFLIRYRANVLITDYSASADALAYRLLKWLDVHQPATEGQTGERMTWEADVLNHEAVDISISLRLSETVTVEQTPGGVLLHHCDEPSLEPEWIGQGWELYVNDELAAEWDE